MTKQNLRKVGKQYEDMAASYLEDNGYSIIDRNFHHHRRGELDLVAKKEEYLIICEVKYRSSDAYGDPLEAITFSKRRSLSKAALGYLAKKGYPADTPLRFDVIGIYGDGQIRHIENAFEFVSLH